MRNLNLLLIKSTFALLLIFLFTAVDLSAQTPQHYNYQNQGTLNNSFPFNVANGKAVNWLLRPGEINQPNPIPSGNSITKVYFYVVTGGSSWFTDLRVLLAQSDLTDLTPGSFYSGPFDTLYYGAYVQLTGPNLGWMSITLDRPFPYDPTKSLIIFVGQCWANGGGITLRQIDVSGTRRTWSVGGCPFVPYNGFESRVLNFGVDITPTTKITPVNTQSPGGYELGQNYPNPFNPTTNIRFSITKTQFVSLKIYNAIGEEVGVLVNENLQPGTYESSFNGSNLTSGIYFYRLQTENFTETKKMTLIK